MRIALAILILAIIAKRVHADQRVVIRPDEGVGIATGAGSTNNGTLRVISASDSPATNVDASSFTVINQSTMSVSNTATLACNFPSNAVGAAVCNEGPESVRIGSSAITQSIGFLMANGGCAVMDQPRFYRGTVYGISLSGNNQKLSCVWGTP